MNAQVLGISVDHIPCLQAWAESLNGINYPLLSDFWPHGAVSKKYGVLRSDGKSERAIFIVDTEGFIQYIDIHDIDDQPSNDEIRRVLREINPSTEDHQVEMILDESLGLPKGGIVVYCTSWCPDCRKAQKWLDERGLEYNLVDITKVHGAAEQVEFWANGNRTTPTFDIDDEILVDWDETALFNTLKQKGYI